MNNDDALKLENQLCFPLYASSRQIIKLYKPYLDNLGITYTQYLTLLALWEKDQVTVKHLGDVLYLDSGTLTPLLKKMESMAILRRIRSTEDERSVLIELTPKGHAMKMDAYDIPNQVASQLTLSQEDAKSLHRILHLLLLQEGTGC